MKKPLIFARELIAEKLHAGGVAVDATCGNGHDTLFLAQQVGSGGTVLAFDIQQQAVDATKERLAEAGLLDRVQLYTDSHANLDDYIQSGIDAMMFNLGYLPGSDHAVVTQPQTTVAALGVAVEKLNKNGIITLVVYTGHAGGQEEYQAVRKFASTLPQRDYIVLEYQLINQINRPPLLLAITRR
ncbi:class I SAM-dependent methyltransferase [Dethiobacter alkaliphilus]|uniref:class I SAM-dependent methyltransferase n=1 Tax=Dethiobacter alkaliphilus TaxID=427926 RepID=UPI002227D20A|nr:class I SAM-dependent methyltransferase [Dethiobacter alkaliphilus]MCW3491194.1 methyltransferase domain-containing protein [Dethiobacter alkaliphilus]